MIDMNKRIIQLTLALSFSLISFSNIFGQTLLHQINRGDINFQLYDDGFKINSISSGNTLLETYKLGAELPIGFASYPNTTVDYVDYIFSVAKDNTLFNQWMTNSITSWTANDHCINWMQLSRTRFWAKDLIYTWRYFRTVK
jgi:hypothetical protein